MRQSGSERQASLAMSLLARARAVAAHPRAVRAPPIAATGLQFARRSSGGFDPAQAVNTADRSPEGAVQLYDAWAATYDETLREWGYEAPEKIAELLADHRSGSTIPLRAPVLDCGCGTGLSSEALSANGFPSLYGVDVSHESLQLCEKKGLHTELKPCELDAEPLPFPDDTFSAVACVGVLSYVQEFDHIFSEWCRTIVPGGLCAFTTRTWDDDTHGIRSAAAALSESGAWRLRHKSEPSAYMPLNPIPEENAKRIRYLVFEVLE